MRSGTPSLACTRDVAMVAGPFKTGPFPEALMDTFEQYARAAGRTMNNGSLAIWGLGIAGEAGEVADVIKKHLGHGHDLDTAQLTRELGDVLWYVAAIAKTIGVTLEEVARANIEKLQRRYPDGFDPERSKVRTNE